MAGPTNPGARKRPAAGAAKKRTSAAKTPAARTTKAAKAPSRAASAVPTPTEAVREEAPAPTPAPAAPTRSSRSPGFTVVSVVLIVAALLLMLKMGSQQRGGPAHEFVSLRGGIPATLYLPVDAEDDGYLPDPLPKGQRPPVVVLAHGYSADQSSMSGIARSLARAGYAVLTFDFRGHGSNTNAFEGELREDVDAAVDWVQTSPFVDADRIAVMGHSMGAGAVLDFATLDSRPEAVIPLSGGFVMNDAVVPANTLLLAASGDPGEIRDRQVELRDDLKAKGGVVVQKVVSGTNHITILRDSTTIADVTTFLDPIFDIDRAKGDTPGLDDPRMGVAFLYLLVALGLFAVVGSLTGRLVPDGPAERNAPPWTSLGLVAGSMLVALPLMTIAHIDPLPVGASEPIVVLLAVASIFLWGGRALAQRGQLDGSVGRLLTDRPWLPLREVGWAGVAAAGVLILLLLPLADVFHRLVPTPERSVYWVVMTLMVLPFFGAFEALVRRGTPGRAAGWGALGRVILLVALFVGLGMKALPGVIGLVAPLLVLQYVMMELFAAGAYKRSRNTAVIAVADAVFIGWLAVTLTPIG